VNLELKSEFFAKKVLILGAGVTGQACARWLSSVGAEVSFADDHASSIGNLSIAAPETYQVQEWNYLLVSPGWKESHPLVQEAFKFGIEILNEVDLAWALRATNAPQQRWVAVTGTNGKTTTVEMAAAILRESGMSAIACGNVGETVIDCVVKADPFDVLVLELSSFQLHWMKDPHFLSVAILNIADDHIDWHGSFDAYAQAKLSLLGHTEVAILNAQDSEVVARTSHWHGQKVFYSLETPAPGELGVVEGLLVDRAFVADAQEAAMLAEVNDVVPTVPHNVSNALAAAGIARTLGVQPEIVRTALQKFTLGRHRIEKVSESNGISWVDDSKATNPHAAAASLLSALSVIWIAGGLAKGAKMSELVTRAKPRIKAAILIGQDRELIERELRNQAPEIKIFTVDAPHDYEIGGPSNSLMEEVVRIALEIAAPGDTVLLAPACASMDQFVSYGDRGDRFAAAVRKGLSDGK
jgi:UDP-N-acetylmuramoylalanine--D-glutamate ligase